MSQQHPSSTPERQSLRERHALRLVTAKEEGVPVRRLSEGVFGYTGSPASEELPLFMVPTFRCFEIHKRKGGEVAFIGYVTEPQYDALQKGAEALALDLYPDPYEASTRLAAIPLSRIDRRKQQARDAGSPMRVDVAQLPG